LEYIRYIATGTVGDYGLACAMATGYVVACLLVIVVVTLVMSKAVFYYE